jgi:predicted Fe-S protein YdhL (DUF1289 family)
MDSQFDRTCASGNTLSQKTQRTTQTRPLYIQMITPCVNLCTVDPATKICQGCRRTLDEIASWIHLTDNQRQEIVNQLKFRQ